MEKTIRFFIGFSVLATIFWIIFYIIFILETANVVKNLDKEYESDSEYIGKDVIYKGDTLKIIDYSFFDNTYTLEDGRKFSVKLIQKLDTTE